MDAKKQFASLRIAFGVVWLIDAYFKWQPQFFSGFATYLSGSLDGQPQLVQQWIGLWVRVVGVNPTFFAYVVAITETLLGVALVIGLLTRPAIYCGIALSLAIWTTAEGFGGPYRAGSTDIGAAIIYVLVFLALLFGRCWEEWSLDAWLRKNAR